jgi:hypothetical protein
MKIKKFYILFPQDKIDKGIPHYCLRYLSFEKDELSQFTDQREIIVSKKDNIYTGKIGDQSYIMEPIEPVNADDKEILFCIHQ